jgi:flagellar hook assembly protein FlgD
MFIMDSGGRRIRTLSLSGLTGGPQTVTWDGLNDAGGLVAPGVYTAWLITTGQRLSVKLVRQP